MDNYPGAKAILQCVYEGCLPMDSALKVERRYFTDIMKSKEAAAMIRSLFISTAGAQQGRAPSRGDSRKQVQENRRARRRASWAPASAM
jgi:3-hydroxyacyl-CoA dehydrogenase/enoyl-CoA hydratase/3-hydroxybutyryl-CoA epimerase